MLSQQSKFSVRRQAGFTLIELAIATVVLLVGVVAVMQLVPNAMQSNLRSRTDSTAVVVAQRQLDQMLSQPVTAVSFTNADGVVCQLGDPAVANAFVGAPVQVVGPAVQINFNAAAVPGYSLTFADPNDPGAQAYEVRWAVATTSNLGQPVGKRIIVGAWRRDPRQVQRPVNLEAVAMR